MLKLNCCILTLTLTLFASSSLAEGADVEERIDALERELADLKQEVAEEKDDAPAAVSAGIPTFQVTDEITFKPGLRLQPRYTHGTRDDHRFYLNRFRLKGGGAAFGLIKYYTELKIDGTGLVSNPNAAVENAWIASELMEYVNLRVGLYDIPMSRDSLTSDSKLLVPDRSLIRGALAGQGLADNTIGATLHGRPMEGRFEYDVGIYQNDDFKEAPTTAVRFVVNLLDPAPKGGYADYRASYIGEGQRLAIGVNYAYTAKASSGTGATFERFDLHGWGGDLFFNTGPFSLQAEWLRFDKKRQGMPNFRTDGGYVQAGYVINGLLDGAGLEPEWLPPVELSSRHQWLDDDIANQRLEWTTVGMNIYFHSHNLKLQTAYTFKDQDKFGSTTLNGNLLQMQLQLDF
jgi:phosphate-selective porin